MFRTKAVKLSNFVRQFASSNDSALRQLVDRANAARVPGHTAKPKVTEEQIELMVVNKEFSRHSQNLQSVPLAVEPQQSRQVQRAAGGSNPGQFLSSNNSAVRQLVDRANATRRTRHTQEPSAPTEQMLLMEWNYHRDPRYMRKQQTIPHAAEPQESRQEELVAEGKNQVKQRTHAWHKYAGEELAESRQETTESAQQQDNIKDHNHPATAVANSPDGLGFIPYLLYGKGMGSKS